MTHHKESSIYATASATVHKNKTVPWISASAPHTLMTDLLSSSLSSSSKERDLLAVPENPRPFRSSLPAVPTGAISEAISKNNAIAPAPAPTSIPAFYPADKVISLIEGTNQTSDAAGHQTVSAPNDKVASDIHLTNPYATESKTEISNTAYETSENTPPIAYEALVRSLQRRSFTKDASDTVFTNVDVNRLFPYQSPGTQTTNVSLETPANEQILKRVLPFERTSSNKFSVSLPTSVGGLLKFRSTAMFISPPDNFRSSRLADSNVGRPMLSLIDEEGRNVKVSTTAMPHAEYLSHLPLNESDAKMHETLHTVDTSFRTAISPLDIYMFPSSTPATERLESPVPASLEVSNTASKGILDTSNAGKFLKTTPLVPVWDPGSWLSSNGISMSSGKTTTQVSPVAEDYVSPTSLRTIYTVVPGLQQQTNYVNKQMPSSTATSPISTSVTVLPNSSVSSGRNSKSFTEFNTYPLTVETSSGQYASFPNNQSVLSQGTEVPLLHSKKDTHTRGNILEYFTVRNINVNSSFGKNSYPVYEDFTAANTRTSTSTDAFSSILTTYDHLWPFVSYAKSQKPQTTNSGNLFASTDAFYATSSPLSSQFIAKLTVPVNKEISAVSSKKTTYHSLVHELLSSTSVLNVEEYMTSGKPTQFTNVPVSGANNYLNKQLTSTGGWDTKGTSDIDTVKMHNEATKITPLQTHTTNTAIITSVHASQTRLTTPLLPKTNFTHSVITVLPSVSPGVIPSVATSEATPVTGKSAPTSPMLTSSLFSLSTENSPSVMALSTLISTLAKNNTATKMAPTLSPVVTRAAFPVVSTDESTTPVHSTSSFPVTKTSTVSAPTTHAPRQTETATHDTKKSTSSDTSKTSTAYPLTITAALTSITASAKTARLLPTPAENTSAATTTVSTSAFANVTTVLPLECQLSRNLLIKTVLFLNTRRLLLSDSLKQNVTKGLTQALRRAFNQNVNAQVEVLEQSNNVTVGYYVTHESLVFIPAVVIEMLIAYGVSNATLDIKQHVPNLHSVAVLALPWDPLPAYHFQLKTELQFVGQSDNIQSCRFVQTMEQRLQKAFQDAERKVLNTSSKLTVQILSTSNVSQAVTLFYVVKNESTVLNGTVSSNLLNHLSAELVGFYLTYPPLTIAEALEYPNLDTSEATRDYWVVTVIQGVDITMLGVNNQSFARLMEQRLAPLFMMSHQQGRRFKRATTVGSYTVQMVKMQRIPGPKEPAELTYYTIYNGKPLLGTTAAKILSTVDSQRMALTLGYVVQVQADPVVKNPPNNLWIIAAVLAPIAVVTVIIIIITAVLCRKNKNDFKGDTMMNLPQRAKPVQGFDYAKQHLGQQGAEDEVLPVTQETVVLPLPVRDAPASQEREIIQDGSTAKIAKSNDTRKSRSPSENGSVISNESGKPKSGRSSPQKVMAQQKVTKEEGRKRNGFKSSKKIVPISDEEEGDMLFDSIAKSAIDPFDTSSGSVQLIAIKPVALPPAHTSSDRNQETAVLNGEVNKALKQKSDIEHYRNKLRLKAKRKGYYDFPQVDNNKGLADRKKMYEKAQNEIDHILDADTDGSSPFVEPKNRQQMKNSVYRSRQSLNSPSPGETEMDLLVTRERQRRGIRNSGYDAYRFSPLPEMVMGSPPPPVPPRTGPVAVTSLRRSTSDIGSKTRISESSGTEQIQPHDHAPFVPVSRAPVSVAPLDQSALNYSGSTVPAVFAIPAANRPGFTGYFIPTPPTAYRNQAWMSYAAENELPGQWADSVPLPGYIEAYSRPRYQHNHSPSRLPRQYSQPANMHSGLEQVPLPPSAASQQSLTENYPLDSPLNNLSTAALVKAIREEVAKLAKKQTDMFEFQV
uniref:KIAA1549 like n=1 Tax=Podarcis muralis TaxID=64176 RepID=A0A670HQ47_PODMU